MANDPPKFNFGGAPSTSSSSTSGLFGTSKASGGSLFGGGGTGQSTGNNLFGGGDANKPAGGGFGFAGFGASSAEENKPLNGATAGGGFGGFGAGSGAPSFGGLGGSQTPPKPFHTGSSLGPGESKGLFGNVSTGGTTSPAPTGSTTPSNFSFNPTTTPAGPPPTDLFAGSTGGNNLFGNTDKDKAAANPFQPRTASRTTAATQPSASGGSLFGGDQAKQPVPTFNWGTPAETSQSTAPATTTSAEPQKSLFGGLGQGTSNTASSTTPSTEAQKPFVGRLGQNNSNTASSSAPSTSSATPSLFFQQPKSKPFQFPSTTPSTTGAATSGSDQSKSLFGGPSAQTPSTGAPSIGNMLNKTPTTSSAAPSASLFSIGVTNPATSGSQTPTSSTAQTATTSAPFSSLFKVPDKPAPATTTSISQPGTTSTAALASTSTAGGPAGGLGTSILGASTTGPTPPAQSRLRNKTMDEILTRWASDLTKYTKEFQSHAETVARWDQLLVESMSKISTLYISAVTAEKQTASVEMQLSAVENQQNELESWLSKYEGEVDEMLAKNGAGQGVMESGGPDQDREKTYKLAEKLNERLEDMGKDLGSMIEEINAANAGLSKTTRADEPITQIVRILNSHLSQLQAIDQGTVALQAKVNAAQKASQGLGFPGMMNGSNGTGSGAAEDFYRSYMGRR